ncbi:MAG: hypothetical protein QXV32_06260 [Conexivisphaerales archaeon]
MVGDATLVALPEGELALDDISILRNTQGTHAPRKGWNDKPASVIIAEYAQAFNLLKNKYKFLE